MSIDIKKFTEGKSMKMSDEDIEKAVADYMRELDELEKEYEEMG